MLIIESFYPSVIGHYNFLYPGPVLIRETVTGIAILDYLSEDNKVAVIISEEDVRRLGLKSSVVWINSVPSK